MTKERRVDPQVTVGLLTSATGFPLEVHLFEGNKAETKTLVPVLTGFAERHDIDDVVVVADAGMLSAANLVALQEAGFAFIVGSRPSSAVDDLADHFRRHGNYFTDGQTVEATRTMGPAKTPGTADGLSVLVQTVPARQPGDQQDDRTRRSGRAGTRPLKKDRFVKITDAIKGVDWDLVERARYLAGLKGYVTNIDADTMDGPHVVAAYHELYQVERSFRMAKSDLAARPMFHRIRDSIEAHLTIVFAALAVSREAQARTGVSIKKIIQTLRPLRTAPPSASAPADHRPTAHPRPRPSHPFEYAQPKLKRPARQPT